MGKKYLFDCPPFKLELFSILFECFLPFCDFFKLSFWFVKFVFVFEWALIIVGCENGTNDVKEWNVWTVTASIKGISLREERICQTEKFHRNCNVVFYLSSVFENKQQKIAFLCRIELKFWRFQHQALQLWESLQILYNNEWLLTIWNKQLCKWFCKVLWKMELKVRCLNKGNLMCCWVEQQYCDIEWVEDVMNVDTITDWDDAATNCCHWLQQFEKNQHLKKQKFWSKNIIVEKIH